MGLLQAGAGVKGEFENRLKSVISEIKASPTPIILFIDEAHTLIGAGGQAGGSDAANLLKPALARGELRTIAATTWSEYKKYFEKDAALARRFQLVKLDEPDVETAVLILRGLKDRYEGAHGVAVRDDAIVAAAELSSRYISGRQLPDKAVDLLDTSAARVKILLTAKPDAVEDRERSMQALEREKKALERDRLHGIAIDEARPGQIEEELKRLGEETETLRERWGKEKDVAHRLVGLRKELYALVSEGREEEKQKELKAEVARAMQELEAIQSGSPLVRVEVDPDVVAKVVSDWTGIPLGRVLRDQVRNVVNLEENLRLRIKGQDEAIGMIGEIIKASKAGLSDPRQPMGIFLLVGPSGVGKTETGLAVADLLFGGDRFLTTINMSEFQEGHTVSRLIGSPPGYVGFGEGGVLTEAVRQRPYSVILIDEVEKAHLDVVNLFYQVFDKGTLSDGEGRIIDFKNTILFPDEQPGLRRDHPALRRREEALGRGARRGHPPGPVEAFQAGPAGPHDDRAVLHARSLLHAADRHPQARQARCPHGREQQDEADLFARGDRADRSAVHRGGNGRPQHRPHHARDDPAAALAGDPRPPGR